MRFRTIILLALTGLCGLGLGALSFFKDGMYSATCLFALPFLVALMNFVVVSPQEKFARNFRPTRRAQPEEEQVYNWPTALFDSSRQAQMAECVRREIKNMPPRFA